MKKLITLSAALQLIFVFLLFEKAYAQPLNTAQIQAQMVKDWGRAKTYTIDYLNTMPANKYSFKAVDSLRSFAQQMLHLAAGNVFLMSNATGSKPLPWLMSDIEHRKSAQTKDSVMYYVKASYDYCVTEVTSLSMDKWGEEVTMFNTFKQSRFALMNKTFEHQGHHRGQTTIYIRLQGIKPPEERLFE